MSSKLRVANNDLIPPSIVKIANLVTFAKKNFWAREKFHDTVGAKFMIFGKNIYPLT